MNINAIVIIEDNRIETRIRNLEEPVVTVNEPKFGTRSVVFVSKYRIAIGTIDPASETPNDDSGTPISSEASTTVSITSEIESSGYSRSVAVFHTKNIEPTVREE